MKIFCKIIVLFILISGCDYKPIFSSKNSSFGISNFKLINENKLSRSIKKALSNYTDLSKKRILTLEIDVKKIKEVTSKNSKGNISSYRVKIYCNFKIYENKKLLKSKKITESFLYSNRENKFEFKKYESEIEKNLLNKIIQELIIELYSI